ncbi:hypothetical protein SUGI_0275820 [Cryptomeria japonica]|uniref:U-box domain-containing protein 25 n=1 Tax=Cryptomeria japonica TaxID=3369 RepID=UPI002408C0CF|nr:U-box domain-containing protein 25 [Cryptomeria japonica]GLJ16324.1 hypothetical protein SUGI_0275820 [Cryptomeria japonica]
MKADELRISTFVPPFFRCPISLEVMRDPVSLCTGVTYDRANIEKWLDLGKNVCPATMEPLQNLEIVPNHTLRRLIQEWCVSKGLDRIPTPKSPANPSKLNRMLQDMSTESDNNRALETLATLKTLAKSSPRNRKCMLSVGILRPLAQLILGSENREILAQAVGIVACFDSLDDATRGLLRGPSLLKSLLTLLGSDNKEARMSAAILVEYLTRDRTSAREMGSSEGLIEGLISVVREELEESVSAGFGALFNLCVVGRNRMRIAEAPDAVCALTDVINGGGDKKLREKCLGVLDALSTTAEGRAAIDDHTLALPAVVKSLLCVSESADEYSVGILWRICFKSGEENGFNEDLLTGAFKKLLVFVQIDSASPTTKAKANQLLKLFSPMRHSHASS